MPVPATYAQATDPKWLGTHLTSTLISCLIFYLGALLTIETYIQLWNKPAFAPHSSELSRTHLNHRNHLCRLLKTCHPHCLASFAFVLVSSLIPSSSLVYCQSPVWLLKHVVVGRDTTFSLPTTLPTQLTERLVGVRRSPETIWAL
ncbi:hypothetical protein HETIRDRAFT_316786 [Heterobasidion irregulare TC 32-1]|uniref:Uncharacterized protein n=1 Tax=Heterobasidion irregulare (strain TC 32-1) TaxID=747525 RepID=W4KBH0_HETIT|nr:uncharacterized protein HETIRDRAFT_316786 [Heterobasidion irregulare TC 32-1]ETW82700.1 hypothetical protein HETIRDRAFT_316786 [Heterobasidion irregulare TC 32-1]